MKKPKTFLIAGIGLLVVAFCYLLAIVMNLGYALVPAMRAQNPVFRLLDEDASFATMYNAVQVLGGGLGVLALVAGLGLIMGRNWGRISGIIWGAGYILLSPVQLWMASKYTTPLAIAEIQQQGTPASPEVLKFMQIGMTVMTVAMNLFFVAACITLIYLLARAKMKAWCASQEQAGAK